VKRDVRVTGRLISCAVQHKPVSRFEEIMVECGGGGQVSAEF
jgi:hypothetical protein